MNWNRRTRRIKIQGNQTVEQLINELKDKLPIIEIDGVKFNHYEGLRNCVLSAVSASMIAVNISSYIHKMYDLYDKLEQDKQKILQSKES